MAEPPNLLQGPDPLETAELHFKIFCKLKIFETETKYGGGHCCVLAVSQYYGLIFVGNLNGFTVIKTKALSPSVSFENFPKRDILLNLRPTHISVDFSQKFLVVVCNSKPGSLLVFYNIQSFANKDVLPLKVTPIDKLVQNRTVVDLAWQPNADGSLMICLSDGSVLALSQGAKDGPVFTLPATAQAMCLCWSPKGKQIVIGSAVGTLSQYKPDLKVVKTLPPPPLFNGAVMVVSVLWISSYQFAVAYNDKDHPESVPVITIVNAVKNEPINIINYDDITYSSNLFRNHQIYMTHQSAWNLIFVSSANSIEVAVLHSKDNTSWEQWLLGDASRAELPLDSDRQETFPLGWAFDFTSQDSIPWGEGTLPPMPRLLLLSDEGLLCIFNVVNVAKNAPQLCSPPSETLDDSLFVVSSSKPPILPVAEAPKPVQPNKSSFGAPPTFESPKPTISYGASTGFGGFGIAKPQQAPTQTVPVINQQQEQLQPQLQIQAQQPPQVLVSLTPPTSSVTTLKLFPPQFGTGLTFSFGGNSASTQSSKSTVSGTALPKVESQPISLTITPSPSSGDLFGKNLSQTAPSKQQEIIIEDSKSRQTLTSEKSEESVVPPGKPEEVPSQAEGSETPELAAVDNSVYHNAIQEEIEHFSSELQQLSLKVGNLDVTVGSEEDKASMKKSLDGLYDFWKELKETTEGQSVEIHATAMDLMEAFAWLEDAKSRNLQRKNPSYIELRKSEELDPLSARHMNEISHLKYYIENQLKQLTSYLEKEWMDHQENYRNEVKSKMAVPPLDEVYKTMHYHLKILHKQKTLVEELKGKIALKKRRNKPQSFLTPTVNPTPVQNNGNRVSELSKLAENLLQLKITKEENSSHTGAWEIMRSQLNAISERTKKLTRDKQTALRDALSECDMVKIRPVKTSLESSAFLRTLALEKASQKLLKAKSEELERVKVTVSGPELADMQVSKPKVKPVQGQEGSKFESTVTAAVESPKFVLIPVEKPSVPLAVDSLPNPEDKSPLASLSGIVSSIGKKNEAKTQIAFPFGNQNTQAREPAKDIAAFPFAKSEQKKEEPKSPQTFTLGTPKLAEPIFGKKEQMVFGGKPIFAFPNSSVMASTKQDSTKSIPAPNVTITPVTTTAATTLSLPFIFNAASSNASTTGLPKVNLFFIGKEQSSGLGTPTTSGSLFSAPVSATQTSSAPLFFSTTPIFGSANKNTTATTFTTSTPFLFGGPKTTSDAPAQSSGFIFTQAVENKPTNLTVATIKPTSETGEVDVVKIDEGDKKNDLVSEKSKDSVKVTVASVVSVSPPVLSKPVLETTSILTPSHITVASTPQNSAATTSIFTKSITTTTTGESAIAAPAVASTTAASVTSTAITTTTATTTTTTATTTTTTTATTTTPTTPTTAAAAVITTTTTTPTSTSTSTSTSTATTTTTASVPTTTIASTTVATTFSFSTVITTFPFGQTTPATSTTPATTTTASLFGTPTTVSGFGQVSSTARSPNIFGGSTPTTSIFGGSTPTKPIFGQAATPSTTTEIIFGGSTPTTNTFTQTATTSPTTFGQKPDSVSQTANLFGQLLSDENRSVFGTSSPTTTSTTTNIFSTSKNLFGGGTTTTTASLFGTTASSIFSQSTPIFGQATTASNIFGQTQSSTSNSFFGQNICSPFGGGTSVTSNQSTFGSGGYTKPIFGQTSFGQTASNTSIFGGSIFGGTPNTTTTNVFQTPTTSTTFGSTTPGPFSGGASSFGETSFGSIGMNFQKPAGGFGSPPVFGGAPAFGGSPTFGGSPSFGSMSTFGSMSQGTFGQTAGSTTFENLANQNTVGFGNLAQQSQGQGFGGGFGSGSSFENKPAFGGNSFSNWRSK